MILSPLLPFLGFLAIHTTIFFSCFSLPPVQFHFAFQIFLYFTIVCLNCFCFLAHGFYNLVHTLHQLIIMTLFYCVHGWFLIIWEIYWLRLSRYVAHYCNQFVVILLLLISFLRLMHDSRPQEKQPYSLHCCLHNLDMTWSWPHLSFGKSSNALSARQVSLLTHWDLPLKIVEHSEIVFKHSRRVSSD